MFLFNVGGYYIVFWALRYQINQEISNRLEGNHFENDEMISLKIPIALPYVNNDEGYRQATGQIEYRGEFYKLVKQKQEGDTLIIVCIKNHEERQLVKTMIDYANLSNDLPFQSKKTQGLLSKLLKEYASLQQKNIISNNGWTIVHVPNTIASLSLDTFEPSVQGPPPKSIS